MQTNGSLSFIRNITIEYMDKNKPKAIYEVAVLWRNYRESTRSTTPQQESRSHRLVYA